MEPLPGPAVEGKVALGAQTCHGTVGPSWVKHLVPQSRMVFSVCIASQDGHDAVDPSWLPPQ